jgi:hypothetical protein
MATSYTILAEGGGTYRVRVKERGIIPGEYFGPFTSEAEAKRFIADNQKADEHKHTSRYREPQ